MCVYKKYYNNLSAFFNRTNVGLIVLEGYTTGAVNGTEDIFIVCQTKESFRFVARSKKERDAWVSVLQEGMTSHDPLPNNHYDTVS